MVLNMSIFLSICHGPSISLRVVISSLFGMIWTRYVRRWIDMGSRSVCDDMNLYEPIWVLRRIGYQMRIDHITCTFCLYRGVRIAANISTYIDLFQTYHLQKLSSLISICAGRSASILSICDLDMKIWYDYDISNIESCTHISHIGCLWYGMFLGNIVLDMLDTHLMHLMLVREGGWRDPGLHPLWKSWDPSGWVH